MPNRNRGKKRGPPNPPSSSNPFNTSTTPSTPTNTFSTTDQPSASSFLGNNPPPRPSVGTGLVDPNFDATRIGPNLGPQLQAERDAGAWQIEQNFGEPLDQSSYVREELEKEECARQWLALLPFFEESVARQSYGGEGLVQQPYAGQWQDQQPYFGESLAQQPYIGVSLAKPPYVGKSVAPPAAYESVQYRPGNPLTYPAAAAAVTTKAVSTSNPQPRSPQIRSTRLRDLPFHPLKVIKWEKKAALEALTTEPGPNRLSPTAPPFQSRRKVAPEVVVSLQDLAAGQGGISNMAPPQRVVPEVGAQLRDLSAGQVGMINTAPIPTPQGVDLNLAAQLQDLVCKPGGIPDRLPPGLTQMPGLDPRFLPGPDGRLPDVPPPPSEPLPDLETQFRNMFAQLDADNAAAAAGPAEPIVPVVPTAPKKLVVVCCLATWIGTKDTDDKWVAMPAQGTRKGWGMDVANPPERECWRKQIWKGLEVLKEMDGEGVLMFSGGPWYDKSQISAAKSYRDFARASNYWGYLRGDKYKDYASRIITEDRAMDSLQNVMYSLIEFNIRYKNFPEEMTVISYELKRQRFENVHFKTAKSLLFPTAQEDIDVSWQGIPTFIGIDPRDLRDNPRSEKAIAISELEMQTYDRWKASPYGLSDELMARKEKRNRWRIGLYYELVFAGGAELVAALERNAKAAPPIEEVMDMSVN